MSDAVVYVRISQDRGGERAGVERQREDCLHHAAQRGHRVVAEHEDNDQSARSGRRREGYEALLADIVDGRAAVVIAWSLDRLQRNRRDELRLYEACQEHGVTLSLVNGSDLDFTTAAGRFVADALGSVARMEVDLKSDRQRRAQEQAARQGRRVGGRRPFGYEQDGVTLRPSEADAIRDGYAQILVGVPLRQIAREWNAAGLRSGQTKDDATPRWAGDTVRRVLTNPRNAGLRAHRGEVVGEAAWPAIVPEETWRATVGMLADTGRRSGGSNARALLTGIALCGVCGATVHAGGSARRGVRSYRCSGSQGHVSRMAEPVEDYVTNVILARLQRDDARALLQDHKRVDLDAAREAANGYRARLESLALEFAEGELTAAQLRAATERLRGRLAEAERTLADAGRANVLGPLVGAGDVAAAWEGLPLDHRRAVIDLLAVVTVHPPGRGVRTFRPDTVDVQWKGSE